MKSSYQKLKEENACLREDIYRLVMEHETLKCAEVKVAWEIKFGLVDAVMYGNRTLVAESMPINNLITSGGILD